MMVASFDTLRAQSRSSVQSASKADGTLTASENDPGHSNSLTDRRSATGQVSEVGYYCATCGKWIAKKKNGDSRLLDNTNPGADTASYAKKVEKETGKN